MGSMSHDQLAVVLIGHGAPATDCPPQLIGELMGLEWRQAHSSGHAHAHQLQGRAAELDATIRDWPRRGENDPYKAGLERLADALRPLLSTGRLFIGYNEFCRPSTEDVIGRAISEGATRILVIPSMLTPGGVHSEKDIPRSLEQLRQQYPQVSIRYVWPFDLQHVATLLATHVQRALDSG